MLEIRQFACLEDNYGFLARCSETGACASIDSPDARVILAEADSAGWQISDIWNTHHHWDHAGGNDAVREASGATITAPASEADKIGHVDRPVEPGDRIRLGALEAEVIDTGGHTLGHIAYWFASENVLFAGDALFALGCGRLFEGTPEQAQAGLARLRALPDAAMVYCAHEYTAANARFARHIDPDNDALARYASEVEALRAEHKPTVPARLGREKTTNPFLRWDDTVLRTRLGLETASDAAVYAAVRQAKDSFR
ncbi:MAG: hydroxyacylglutathione hydrolase [Oceanicaulis sp.]|uniref:hydroxyacylglutathione hydrolase n=1 Tax=Glycocaulis sp. TaxID=1969725 RepID=UPI0025BF29CC|nr:hydroxyacylglutathione hydrolase [Glycocaulis sp.]MCC5982344.1 hydroxyacylglutathione hydrolase [Oceanicaulis sp.]MCH8521518.1 hydroxyacylglutathione hydrolase [Glycocaulis sp.]